MKIQIEDRNHDGRGRGRHGRRVVLVSGAQPGDRVTLKVDRETRGTVQGRVARFLEKSPERISHPCRHEIHCTGCPLLGATEADEREFKEERIRRVLRELSLDPGLLRRLERPSGLFHYRHLAKQTLTRFRGRVVPGAYVAGTHKITDTSQCPVLLPELAALSSRVAAAIGEPGAPLLAEGDRRGMLHLLARQNRRGEQLLLLVTSAEDGWLEARFADRLLRDEEALVGVAVSVQKHPSNNLLAGTLAHQVGRASLTETVAGFEHEIGARSFFQIQPVVAEWLAETILEAAGEGSVCLEGFSGVGTFTLPLSRSFECVRAVESHADAAAASRESVRRAGLEGRVEVVEGDAAATFAGWLEEGEAEVAVLDPPRKGLGEELAGRLGRSALRRIVLVSCDPTTLDRDLPPLLAAGFRLRWSAPVDQFPRTAHVETVTLLTRETGGATG